MQTPTTTHLSSVQVASAISEIALVNGAPARRVKLLPIGTFTLRDGRGPFRVRDSAHANQVVAATRAWLGAADFNWDYNHQVLATGAAGGAEAVAAGWSKLDTLRAESDGIYIDVDWTQRATERLRAREFRYVSPLFMARPAPEGGDVIHLKNAALVNIGAIDLPAIAASVSTSAGRQVAAFASAIGVGPNARIEEIAAALGKCNGQQLAAAFGPLSEVERDVCRMTGMSEGDFIAAKVTEQIAAAIGDGTLDGTPGPLSEIERDVCHRMGMSEADFLAEKARLAGQ